MNRNPKEKPARLYLRVSPQEKKKIEDPAKNCGLSTAEYLRKRALGYVPKPAISDTFIFSKLFVDIYAEIIDAPSASKK